MEILTLMMIQNTYYVNKNMICLYTSTHIYIHTHVFIHIHITCLHICTFLLQTERQSRKIGKQLQSVAPDFCTKGGTLQIWRLKAWYHFCRMGLVINHSSEILGLIHFQQRFVFASFGHQLAGFFNHGKSNIFFSDVLFRENMTEQTIFFPLRSIIQISKKNCLC